MPDTAAILALMPMTVERVAASEGKGLTNVGL